MAIMSMPALAGEIKSGNDLIAAMHKKYDGKWYKTLTFRQKTVDFKADGTSETNTWYEAMSVPGKLRIDMEPVEKWGGMLFADGHLYSYRDGKQDGTRAMIHPLLTLGFDVYAQPVETTIAQLKTLNIDMASIHQEKWQGQDVYVVGAKQGDMTVPQFWISKKDLLFVRLIQLGGRDKKVVRETQFNKYVKVKGGGWVSPEVIFIVDGKTVTTEEYTEIKTDIPLDAALWNPEKWSTVERTYFQKK